MITIGNSLTTNQTSDQQTETQISDQMENQERISCPEPIPEDFSLFEAKESELWPTPLDITYTILNQRYEQIKRLHQFYVNQYIEYLKMENQIMVLLSDRQELNDSNDSFLKQNFEQRLEDENHSLSQLIESLRTKLSELREQHQRREDMIEGNWDYIQNLDLH